MNINMIVLLVLTNYSVDIVIYHVNLIGKKLNVSKDNFYTSSFNGYVQSEQGVLKSLPMVPLLLRLEPQGLGPSALEYI